MALEHIDSDESNLRRRQGFIIPNVLKNNFKMGRSESLDAKIECFRVTIASGAYFVKNSWVKSVQNFRTSNGKNLNLVRVQFC